MPEGVEPFIERWSRAAASETVVEEAAGTIRWLRPDYQSPTGTTTAQTALALTKAPWPKTLADRVRLVDESLAKHFTRAKPSDISEILETLTTLGRAHRDGGYFTA